MARIRTIKPSLARHEKLFDLEQETGWPMRFIWAMLPTICDREGRFEWRPRALKSEIVPYDDLDFSQVLDTLATRGFIVKYARQSGEVEKLFGVIPTFTKHQVINNRESPSELPDAKDKSCELIVDVEEFYASATRQPRVNNASATREARDDEVEKRKGREGKGKERKNSVSDSSLRSESNTSPPPERPQETFRDHVGRLRYVGSEQPVYPDVKLSWRHNPSHPESDFTGPKWLDEHGRACTETGELLVVPRPDAEPPPDWKQVLFSDCLHRFADAANKDPGKVRALIGKWLKDIGGDSEAEALVRIMDDAAQTPKADRIAWVTRAVINRRKARRESVVG